ncbi:hypothetical protein [Cellulomonas marina]|uniref:Uncharacterized protein n=1 Tax=Cellulomonas marina TaxID=988821 RepID=A0A1I0Y5K8_9CELL|nr:hypothetical protein [Cellulomonas marina]GIG29808.1 hypothetical protein Cma02nite_24080 [Cellulomonas marina]SFB08522.1 hypothetical protein SAMN05421867_106191 [Cellulomonas marina]
MRFYFDAHDELTSQDADALVEQLGTLGLATTEVHAAPPRGVAEMLPLVQELVVTAAAASVAVNGILAVIGRFRRGVVVDASADELSIRPDRALPPGSVVVVGREGRPVTLDRGDGLAGALTELVKGRR